jgi:hypothetical protein
MGRGPEFGGRTGLRRSGETIDIATPESLRPTCEHVIERIAANRADSMTIGEHDHAENNR